MKQNLLRSFIAALTLLPAIAVAHPGHSAFDPTVAPHPGHAGEFLLVLCGAFGLLLYAVRGFLKNRR
jgi:hypothetical protein